MWLPGRACGRMLLSGSARLQWSLGLRLGGVGEVAWLAA